VIDPTRNVLDKVTDAVARLDDLAALRDAHVKEMLDLRAAERDTAVAHIGEMANLRATLEERINTLRATHSAELSNKESARLDAIRAVDREAVTRAAEASAAQASVLATQVQASAEQVRGQVEQTRIQFAATLTAALEPIQKDVADLRRVQYEQAGQQGATTPIGEQLGPILREIADLRREQYSHHENEATEMQKVMVPVLKEIADLRREQYTQSGARGEGAERRAQSNFSTTTVVLIAGIVVALLVGIGGIFVATSKAKTSGGTTVLPSCVTAVAGVACVK